MKQRQVRLAGIPVNPEAFSQLTAQHVLNISRYVRRGNLTREVSRVLRELNPILEPQRSPRLLCGAPLARFLQELVRVKEWGRDVQMSLEDELQFPYRDASLGNLLTVPCGDNSLPFKGPQPIYMPGTGELLGITGGGQPDFVEKVCFWLERAFSVYTSSPLNLPDPTAVLGPIEVKVGTAAMIGVGGNGVSSAASHSIYLVDQGATDDELAITCCHELMHVFQLNEEFLNLGKDSFAEWYFSFFEGGAVLAEDFVIDPYNRYIGFASQELADTHGYSSLEAPSGLVSERAYHFSLFLKYQCEQQSNLVTASDEPTIGADAYAHMLLGFSANAYDTTTFENIVGALPWGQSFFRIHFADVARRDELSSETLLGNYWLALYLKDFGSSSPDRRFTFMENADVSLLPKSNNGVWVPSKSMLPKVQLTSDLVLGEGQVLVLTETDVETNSVVAFGAQYHKVSVSPEVDSLRVDFVADDAFSLPLIQIVLVEPGSVVRDIVRSDRTNWSPTFANSRGGITLDHVLIVVAGTEEQGRFSLTVSDAQPVPDVMITRWNHRLGTSYEIDPFGNSWTWASPDIWVDNTQSGLSSTGVSIGRNNKLFVRLHNQGHVDAVGITVTLEYQDAAFMPSMNSWQPVCDLAGNAQQVNEGSLNAGASAQWWVNWAPAPTAKHVSGFSLRAIVSVPGDPNTDNKRCLSNFAVIPVIDRFIDIVLPHTLPVDFPFIPPVPPAVAIVRDPRWSLSESDLESIRRNSYSSSEISPQIVRVYQRSSRIEPHEALSGQPVSDSRALPPSLEGVPLVTFVQRYGAGIVGGFTWALQGSERPHGGLKARQFALGRRHPVRRK